MQFTIKKESEVVVSMRNRQRVRKSQKYTLMQSYLHNIQRLALPIIIRREVLRIMPFAMKCASLNRAILKNA